MVMGVKANDYNASYEEVMFDVIARDKVYEIRDVNSGLTFFIDKDAFYDNTRSKKRVNGNKDISEGHRICRRGDREISCDSHKNDADIRQHISTDKSKKQT